MFERLVWQGDRVLLDDLVFLIEGEAKREGELRDDVFWLFKTRAMVDEYDAFFAAGYPGFSARNVFELGIWEGGSAVLLMECLRPSRLVAVDLMDRGDRPAFTRYVQQRGLEGRLKTFWATDQADSQRLCQIVDQEFDAPLDLVIDDASHFYGPTKASFVALFPFLRPGGLYIIEDWTWEFVPRYRKLFPVSEPGLSGIVSDIARLTGAADGLIARFDVRKPFLAVERGPASAEGARREIARTWDSRTFRGSPGLRGRLTRAVAGVLGR